MDIPAPGGSVGIKTFAIYAAGATAGVALYFTVLTNYVPDSWEAASLGPLNGAQAFIGVSALLGAAAAAMILHRK